MYLRTITAVTLAEPLVRPMVTHSESAFEAVGSARQPVAAVPPVLEFMPDPDAHSPVRLRVAMNFSRPAWARKYALLSPRCAELLMTSAFVDFKPAVMPTVSTIITNSASGSAKPSRLRRDIRGSGYGVKFLKKTDVTIFCCGGAE